MVKYFRGVALGLAAAFLLWAFPYLINLGMESATTFKPILP